MKKQVGFTLIELLVVIGIIGLLAAISVFALNNIKSRARDAKRAADINQLTRALDLLANQNNASYPIQDPPICLDGDDAINQALIQAELINQPIVDPTFLDGANCFRYSSPTGSGYTLQYFFEGSSVGEPGLHTQDF